MRIRRIEPGAKVVRRLTLAHRAYNALPLVLRRIFWTRPV